MPRYQIQATGGDTYTVGGDERYNIQVIGIAYGKNPQDAINNYFQDPDNKYENVKDYIDYMMVLISDDDMDYGKRVAAPEYSTTAYAKENEDGEEEEFEESDSGSS